ncbi:MAG: hypothetical protein EPO27_10665 [Betaproteobacteria bacterium]|nr:MAG: hypothetical protein EPO27_10665 [Betaproteobacteria bacterium]
MTKKKRQQTQVNPAEIDGRIEMLAHQRNQALDRNVLLAGQVAALTQEVAGLKQRLDSAQKARIEALEAKVAAIAK